MLESSGESKLKIEPMYVVDATCWTNLNLCCLLFKILACGFKFYTILNDFLIALQCKILHNIVYCMQARNMFVFLNSSVSNFIEYTCNAMDQNFPTYPINSDFIAIFVCAYTSVSMWNMYIPLHLQNTYLYQSSGLEIWPNNDLSLNEGNNLSGSKKCRLLNLSSQ